MQVNFCRGDIGVSQQILNVADADAACQQMRRTTGMQEAYFKGKKKIFGHNCMSGRQNSLTPTGVRRQETGIRSWKSSTYADLGQIIHVPVLEAPKKNLRIVHNLLRINAVF